MGFGDMSDRLTNVSAEEVGIVGSGTIDIEKKAWKLIEALAEPCEQDGDEHPWCHCRRCLAVEELGHKGARTLLRSLLALRDSRAGASSANAAVQEGHP